MNRFSIPLLAFATTVVVAATASESSSPPRYVPTRISFEELAHGSSNSNSNSANTDDDDDDDDDVFWKTLREVGLLSITNVPNLNKQSMLRDLEDCLHDPMPKPPSVQNAQETNNNISSNINNRIGAPDFAVIQGNNNNSNINSNSNSNSNINSKDHQGRNSYSYRRRTLATHTLDGHPEGMFVATKSEGNDSFCLNLEASSQRFRAAVQGVSEAIAGRFGSLPSGIATQDANNNANRFLSIERVINDGEHLEHFHSYYSVSDAHSHATTTTTESKTKTKHALSSSSTIDIDIDWHTDQGMMLLFTPGQRRDGATSDGFFIRLKDGSTVEVDFDSSVDDLVIMLGDGVHQYINNGESERESATNNRKTELRAVPHAVVLANADADSIYTSPRLWYGRMVLPPPNAIHPLSGHNSADDNADADATTTARTFGEIRDSMIRGDESALPLGCASSRTMVLARELMSEGETGEAATATATTSCDEETSMLCWMRCMVYTDYDVSPSSCEASGDDYELQCANDDGEIWESGHDSSYYLQCLASNSTDNYDDLYANSEDSEDTPSSASSSALALAVGGIASAAAMGFVAVSSGW